MNIGLKLNKLTTLEQGKVASATEAKLLRKLQPLVEVDFSATDVHTADLAKVDVDCVLGRGFFEIPSLQKTYIMVAIRPSTPPPASTFSQIHWENLNRRLHHADTTGKYKYPVRITGMSIQACPPSR